MLQQIVTRPPHLTPDWFTSVLGDDGALGDATVTDIHVEPVGGGLMCQMLRVGLAYDTDTEAPASVIVKFPTEDPGSLGLAKAMGMYELEVHFYQEIARPASRPELPRCHFAAIDLETGDFTLVLEDHSDRTRPGDVLQASSLDECAQVLQALVAFQAPMWNSPALQELDWLNNPQRVHASFDAMSQGLEPFLRRFGDAIDPEHVALFERVLPLAGAWARNWRPPTVIQHGDFRSDNVLFATDPDAPSPVTIVDFQTIRVGPAGVDPAYFLGSSLPTDDRRSSERDLIKDYHRGLLAAGVDGYDYDVCWNGYRAGAMYAIYLFVGVASQVVSTERGDRVIANQIRRYADMALDLDAPAAAGLT